MNKKEYYSLFKEENGVIISSLGGAVMIQSPYLANFVSDLKKIKSRKWLPEDKAWIFLPGDKKEILQLVDKYYQTTFYNQWLKQKERGNKLPITGDVSVWFNKDLNESLNLINNDCDSYVYFIKGGDKIKIGYSVDPKSRLKELQTGNGDKLEILFCIKGDATLESNIHKFLIHARTNGEWFDNNDPKVKLTLINFSEHACSTYNRVTKKNNKEKSENNWNFGEIDWK